jgi:diguanylate cyclase (GGDEF)-like protein
MGLTPESYHAVFNSIPDHVAIIEKSGVIVETNTAWNDYARQNGGSVEAVGAGKNYLDICRQAQDEDTDSAQIYQGLNDIVDRQIAEFSLVYPCHSPDRPRWFKIRCRPLSDNADSHVLISHTDVTDTAASHPDFNATSGALIGLPVRSAFEQALNLEWRRAMRQAAPVSLIMLDIDCFSEYNQRYGIAAGEDVLNDISRLLTYFTRRPGDMAACYTDRVFALMFGATNEAVAAGFANHIVRALRNLNIAHEQSQIAPFVTASVGLATLRPKRGYTEDMLLQLTQQALYDAQDRGGNTVVTNRVRVL